MNEKCLVEKKTIDLKKTAFFGTKECWVEVFLVFLHMFRIIRKRHEKNLLHRLLFVKSLNNMYQCMWKISCKLLAEINVNVDRNYRISRLVVFVNPFMTEAVII